jgi:hypothetical protein
MRSRPVGLAAGSPLPRVAAYASRVTPDEVGRYAESLPEVKRKGTESRPARYVLPAWSCARLTSTRW